MASVTEPDEQKPKVNTEVVRQILQIILDKPIQLNEDESMPNMEEWLSDLEAAISIPHDRPIKATVFNRVNVNCTPSRLILLRECMLTHR